MNVPHKLWLHPAEESSVVNVSIYYELSEARITNYTVNIIEEGDWQETFTLSFSKIHFKYTPFSTEEEKNSPSSYEHKL